MKKKTNKKKLQYKDAEKVFNKKNILWLSFILIACFIIYSPSLDNEYVKWDDDWMVYENPDVINFSAATISHSFAEFYKGQYSPVCTFSLGLQYTIGGGKPLMFHLFGILYHLINIVLVFWFVYLLFRSNRIALIVTILFGVHSLQVESVVWISAQKVILYTIFFLASCISYIKYVENRKLINYWLALLFFIISFFAKEQAVTLAISLIAIDFILKRKILDKKVILEKVPFLILAIIMGIITIMSSRTGEFFTDENKNPFHEQIAYSSYAFIQYFLQMIFPFKMSAFHPYPTGSMKEFSYSLWIYLVPVFLIIYIFFKSIKKNPVITFGILFFIMNIALVLQLMPLRDFIIADRYVYIPAIGFFLVIAWYSDKIISRNNKYKNPVIAVISVYALLLSIVSFNRSDVWKDSLTLFTDIVEKYPESSVGWNNRGLALSNLDRDKEAIEDYLKAIKYNPSSVFCYNNIGISYTNIGSYEKAFKSFDAAIKMRPDFAQAYYNRADTKSNIKDFSGAISDYEKFIELRPSHIQAYISLGITRAKAGDFQKALIDLNKAVQLQPGNPEAHLNRGVIHLNLKNYTEAVQDFNATLKTRPNFNYAFFNRGLAKINLGDRQGGCSDLQKAYQFGFQQAAGAIQQYCQ